MNFTILSNSIARSILHFRELSTELVLLTPTAERLGYLSDDWLSRGTSSDEYEVRCEQVVYGIVKMYSNK
jgi:hypothetical protein